MALGDVLVHVARPEAEEEQGPKIEGERDVGPRLGVPFDCFLMLPGGAEERTEGQRGRSIRRPTILYEPEDRAGGGVVLTDEDKLYITAEELTGPDPVKWQVVGTPEPMAAPGELIGFEATLARVDD